KEGIDKHRQRAFEWIRQFLPELFTSPFDEPGKLCLDEAGREVMEPKFDWQAEWPRWQRNLQALSWLAEAKRRSSSPTAVKEFIPHGVHEVLDETIGTTCPMILADYVADAQIVLQYSGDVNATGHISSLKEFWQCVFVSFFDPIKLPHAGSFCAVCKNPLPT